MNTRWLKMLLLFIALSQFSIAQNINKAEYFFDTDPGVGNATNINVGTPNDTINLSASIVMTNMSVGLHNLYIRFRYTNGQWSLPEYRTIYTRFAPANVIINKMEYFFDTDPGAGNGINIPTGAANDTITKTNFAINTTGLSTGVHNLYVRARRNNNSWGIVESRSFYITSPAFTSVDIDKMEYFFDVDSGPGKGINIPTGSLNDTITKTNFAIITTGLNAGVHNLYVRARRNNGVWGLIEQRSFYLSSSNIVTQVNAVEYFFDTDPGVGFATNLPIGSPAAIKNIADSVIVPCLATGQHIMYVRARDQFNRWSIVEYDTLNTNTTVIVTPSGTINSCNSDSVILKTNNSIGSTYQWKLNGSNILNATSNTFVAKVTGSYNVVVTCGATTATSNSVVVNMIAPIANPTITPPGNVTICSGNTITLTSSAATGNIWSNGATTQSITVSTTGSFSVQQVVSGCSSLPSVTKIVSVNPTPIAPTITAGGPTSFCAGGSVQLTSSVVNGNIWSNGATTQSITVTTSGPNSVTQTVNGCTSAASLITSVAVNPIPVTPTITASGPLTFCAGDSVILTSSAIGGNIWSNGSTNRTIKVFASGTFTVVKTGNGCASPSSQPTIVTVNPIPTVPTVTANGPTTFCSGGNVELTSSALTGNLWSNGASTQSVTIVSSVTLTVTQTVAGCTSPTSAPTVVKVNALPNPPTITASGPTDFCSGGNVKLTSSASSGILWSNGSTTTKITVTTSGTFTVAKITNGCSSLPSIPVVVTVNPTPATPVITPSGPLTFCAGGNVVLNSSNEVAYLWSNGSTAHAINVTSSGTFSVTVTNASGCKSVVSLPTTVVVNANPVANMVVNGSNVLCSGASRILNGGIALNYLWSTGETTQTITVQNGGTYTISLSNNGCTASASVSLTSVNPTAVLSGSSCAGTGTIQVVSTSPIQNTVWNYNGNTLNDVVSYEIAGTLVAGGNGQGSGLNQLNGSALGITVDNQQRVYIADNGNNRVVRWSPGASQGVIVAGNGSAGSLPFNLTSPRGVFLVGDTVYVTDDGNGRVMKWAPGATFGDKVAGGNGAGIANNQLSGPSDVVVDSLGTVYVCDEGNNRVMRWLKNATTGVRVAGGTAPGSTLNKLNNPIGLKLDTAGALFISDINNHRLVKWPAGATTGQIISMGSITAAPLRLAIDKNQDIYLALGTPQNVIRKKSAATGNVSNASGNNGSGTSNIQLNDPHAVALDNAGNLYVSEVLNSRVLRFRRIGSDTLRTQNAGTYQAIITTTEGCVVNSNSIVVDTVAFAAGVITGPTKLCANQTGIVYTLTGISNAATYNWKLPVGMLPASGISSDTITVPNTIFVSTNASFVGGNIQVHGVNSCGGGTYRSLSLTQLTAAPATPTTINGLTGTQYGFCAGTTYSFVTNSSQATLFTWTATTTLNGSTTSAITNTSTGLLTLTPPTNYTSILISVVATNCIGTSAARNLTIKGLPTIPNIVSNTGSNVICPTNTDRTFNIGAGVVGDTAFHWELINVAPTGSAQITTSGIGVTETVHFNFDFQSCNLSVIASNNCGINTKQIFLSKVPFYTDVFPTGPSTVCKLSAPVRTYSHAAVDGATSFIWSSNTSGMLFSDGVQSPTNPLTTTALSVSADFSNAQTGQCHVTFLAQNACGSGSGQYTKNVTLSSCKVSGYAIEESQLQVFPNPTHDKVIVSFNSNVEANYELTLIDVTGREVLQQSGKQIIGDNLIELNLEKFAMGVYSLQLKTSEQAQVVKVLIE